MNILEQMNKDNCEACPRLLLIKRIPVSTGGVVVQTLEGKPVSNFNIYSEMYELLKKMQRELGDQPALFAFDYTPPGLLKIYVASKLTSSSDTI